MRSEHGARITELVALSCISSERLRKGRPARGGPFFVSHEARRSEVGSATRRLRAGVCLTSGYKEQKAGYRVRPGMTVIVIAPRLRAFLSAPQLQTRRRRSGDLRGVWHCPWRYRRRKFRPRPRARPGSPLGIGFVERGEALKIDVDQLQPACPRGLGHGAVGRAHFLGRPAAIVTRVGLDHGCPPPTKRLVKF